MATVPLKALLAFLGLNILIGTAVSVSKHMSSLVIYPIQDSLVGSKYYHQLVVGATLNLTCVVQSPLQDPLSDCLCDSYYEINWYLSSVVSDRMVLKPDTNRHQLIIRDLQKTDTGNYKCTAARKVLRRSSDCLCTDDRDEVLTQEVVVNVTPRNNRCGSKFFQCPLSGHCIHNRYLCDGQIDCDDAADEAVEMCGLDPCNSKLRCEDHRCMDPGLCCNPDIDANCTTFPSCCNVLIKSSRHFYQMGIETKDKGYKDLNFLHSTVYTIVGCIVAFALILLLVTGAMCRLHVKRSLGTRRNPRGATQTHPPITLHDLDVYFSSLRRVESGDNVDRGGVGITYNINNGVQIVGRPVAPPPYSEVHAAASGADPPPPYNSNENLSARQAAAASNMPLLRRVDSREDIEEDNNNNNNEHNNNGDINGNSDMVDNNILAAQRAQQPQAQDELAALLASSVPRVTRPEQ